MAPEQSFVKISEKGLEETLEAIAQYPEVVRATKRRGLRSSSFFLQQRARKFIETKGAGTWPKAHPLTAKLRSVEGPPYWKRRLLFRGPFYFMRNFVRFRVNKRNTRSEINFGKTDSGEEGRFDRRLVRLADRVQEGYRLRVSDKMRRRMGALRRKATDEPGSDFFPLRKTTRVLKVPKRPILDRVFTREKSKIFPTFDRTAGKEFEKQEGKL